MADALKALRPELPELSDLLGSEEESHLVAGVASMDATEEGHGGHGFQVVGLNSEWSEGIRRHPKASEGLEVGSSKTLRGA